MSVAKNFLTVSHCALFYVQSWVRLRWLVNLSVNFACLAARGLLRSRSATAWSSLCIAASAVGA